MPLQGLLNPKNAAPDTGGGFKEGYIRVDSSVFKVVTPGAQGAERGNFVALVWDITRLDESMEPLTDEHDQPLIEKVQFSLGGKSLVQVHPGKANSPDDTEIEDAGDRVGAEGPTLHLVNLDWQIHPKSGIKFLYESLQKFYDEVHIDRVWAPDHVGTIGFMGTVLGEGSIKDTDGKDQPFRMKVMTKVVTKGYEKKGGTGAAKAGGKASAGADKVDTAVEDAASAALMVLSQTMDGETLTIKRLGMKVTEQLKADKVDNKLHFPVTGLVKDVSWLTKNAKKFDLSVDAEDNTVTFGQPKK